MSMYEFLLTGTQPLLMHRDDIDGSDSLEAWRKNPKNKGLSKAGDDRSPAWTWQTYIYCDDDANIVMPSDNVMASLIGAGAQMSGGKGGKTLKRGAACGLLIPDEFLELKIGGKVVSMKPFFDRPAAQLVLRWRTSAFIGVLYDDDRVRRRHQRPEHGCD